MRFLDTRTGAFVELVPEQTGYAILSHTWDEEGEQSYKELRRIQRRYSKKSRCPLHGIQNLRPPSPCSPGRPLDASPLPLPTEGCSNA